MLVVSITSWRLPPGCPGAADEVGRLIYYEATLKRSTGVRVPLWPLNAHVFKKQQIPHEDGGTSSEVQPTITALFPLTFTLLVH